MAAFSCKECYHNNGCYASYTSSVSHSAATAMFAQQTRRAAGRHSFPSRRRLEEQGEGMACANKSRYVCNYLVGAFSERPRATSGRPYSVCANKRIVEAPRASETSIGALAAGEGNHPYRLPPRSAMHQNPRKGHLLARA